MPPANRANIYSSAHKVAKKHYTSAGADKRTLLEQLVFAAILENAPRKVAEDSYKRLEREYIDWNEIRVTSVPEIKEILAKHPQPDLAANRLKTLLQNIFEALYAFDLESLKKGNQGKAVAQIEKYGATPFIVGYVTQHALGGHAIPVDKALLDLMVVLGAITDKEAEKGTIPGLERAVPKTKGIEFADVIHELAVDFQSTPFSKKLRDLLTDIAPDAKSRFPKRGGEDSGSISEESSDKPQAATKKKRTASKPAAEKATAEKKPTAKKTTTKKLTTKAPKASKKSTKATSPESAPKKSKGTKKTATKKSASRITKKKPK